MLNVACGRSNQLVNEKLDLRTMVDNDNVIKNIANIIINLLNLIIISMLCIYIINGSMWVLISLHRFS